MNSSEIRNNFLNYFKGENHSILKSTSVITPDQNGVTNSTLFNTAGVQPLIPYILKGHHQDGSRLASVQKCIRTIDIDEVGDRTHLTFFEMLGNWSLGDYFKSDAIRMSYIFLTSKEFGLGLDPKRLYVTVFKGNEYSPKDEEAFNEWKKFVPENRIYFLESNWWSAGDNGPCGPDTEMFYDLTEDGLGDLSFEEYIKADEKQQIIEIWNNVFMQFEKKNGKIIGKLDKFAVDTGAGLERLTTVLNKKESVYETDLFKDCIENIKNNSQKYNETSARIIADHTRASIIIINDGITPSNTDRGYVLRKILRRILRHAKNIEIKDEILYQNIDLFIKNLSSEYSDLIDNSSNIKNIVKEEFDKFEKTLQDGLKEINKIRTNHISGEDAFKLFSSYGMPIELICEIAKEKNIQVDIENFKKEFEKHQNLSRNSSSAKFKGGLSGNSEIEKRYHTATHLLHQALFDVLGSHIEQRGSNINTERMRFDFSHTDKMALEQINLVEKIVNEKINLEMPVNKIELPKEEAIKLNARHLFNEKYPDKVSVYYIGSNLENAYSKEFCGGPHVNNTKEIGSFKILKEESVAKGIRRIKAIIE